MIRRTALVAALVAAVAAPAAVAHELDHPAPIAAPPAMPSLTFSSGGEGAQWELLGSIPTGNPHSDIEFFERGGETYVSAGTLGVGPNGGGQTIVQLTDGGEIAPKLVSSHPSAACIANEANALGLQHDVEASPKGDTILNSPNRFADRRETQVLIDATDAAGRCHDGGLLGLDRAVSPRGGLEIIDVTDPEHPVEIGLTSHIGEAHTVNVDPKRPHIAYAVSSDSTTVSNGTRNNENPTSSQRFNLDGFEVVDFSSCLDFPEGTSVAAKREACRPEVYRYRWPTLDMALGHTIQDRVYGCHELEVYANDRLTCGSGQALLVFDMQGAFDDNGTPGDFSDDRPRGEPLPCRVRPSSTQPAQFGTGAMVVDCVDGEGEGNDDLTVAKWLQADGGPPSLEGVEHVGTVFHQGRNATAELDPAYDSTEDIDFNHEAEYTESGNFLLATDERGGGVAPPGAACSPAEDIPAGNGGIHAYRADALKQTTPETAEEAWESYARTPDGEKAIHRATIRTQPQASLCTAHVFHQIPGQNRIFMGWYSQGTQVVDFVEHDDGSIEFQEAGWFIPLHANTWTSAIFKYEDNGDGTFTYWGATGDFNLGAAGRSAIDVYKVTLPAPPTPADGPGTQPPEEPQQPDKPGKGGGKPDSPGKPDRPDKPGKGPKPR